MRISYPELDNERLEGLASANKATEAAVKRAGFDLRIMKLEESEKKAKTEEEKQKYERIKKQSLGIYNKYNNSNFKN